MKQTTPGTDYRLQVLLALCILVNCSGLFITILGPDGALYASIAKTMAQRNNFIELFAEGRDWLDKPHFPFWITALSFKIFGINTWAYKLPAILFILMGAAYTYQLAKELYNRQVGYWSVIVLLTAEHIIISNNDVRAEPYLTGLIIASVFHFYQSHRKNNYGHLVAGALFAACAVMTKGMFALIPIGGAVAGELIIKRNWKALFHIRWFIAMILVLLFITPELYCLYYQFDLHPEKTVFGRTGVSGIRFFFWDSQFGRFFNTGPIKGKGDPLFFVHTTLWAFLPWSLLLYAAIYKKIRDGIRDRNGQEWYTLSGALLCFLVFSASSFQLPHYINIIFPFFAIITAQYVLLLQRPATLKTVNGVQTGIIILLLLLLAALHYFFRPGQTWILFVLLVLAVPVWLYFRPLLRERRIGVLLKSALVIIGLNLYLNLVFYPALLKYQSGSEAAFVLNRQYPGVPVVQLREKYSYALEFYLDRPLLTADSTGALDRLPRPFILYAPAEMVTGTIQAFDHFHVSRLTGKLLNHATRQQEVERYGLYWIR